MSACRNVDTRSVFCEGFRILKRPAAQTFAAGRCTIEGFLALLESLHHRVKHHHSALHDRAQTYLKEPQCRTGGSICLGSPRSFDPLISTKGISDPGPALLSQRKRSAVTQGIATLPAWCGWAGLLGSREGVLVRLRIRCPSGRWLR